MTAEKGHWLKAALQVKGSIIKSIYGRVIVCGVFGVLISILYYYKLPVSQPILGSVIPSIVLG